MSDIRWHESLLSLGNALDRLRDILEEPLDKNDHEKALEIHDRIKVYYPEMRSVYTFLSQKFPRKA